MGGLGPVGSITAGGTPLGQGQGRPRRAADPSRRGTAPSCSCLGPVWERRCPAPSRAAASLAALGSRSRFARPRTAPRGVGEDPCWGAGRQPPAGGDRTVRGRINPETLRTDGMAIQVKRLVVTEIGVHCRSEGVRAPSGHQLGLPAPVPAGGPGGRSQNGKGGCRGGPPLGVHRRPSSRTWCRRTPPASGHLAPP